MRLQLALLLVVFVTYQQQFSCDAKSVSLANARFNEAAPQDLSEEDASPVSKLKILVSLDLCLVYDICR